MDDPSEIQRISNFYLTPYRVFSNAQHLRVLPRLDELLLLFSFFFFIVEIVRRRRYVIGSSSYTEDVAKYWVTEFGTYFFVFQGIVVSQK